MIHNNDARLECLQGELEKSESRIMELERDLDVVNRHRIGDIEGLKAESAIKTTTIEKLQAEIAKLEGLRNQLQKELQESSGHLTRASNQLAHLREKLKMAEHLSKKI